MSLEREAGESLSSKLRMSSRSSNGRFKRAEECVIFADLKIVESKSK
jgi:hypothetical protein